MNLDNKPPLIREPVSEPIYDFETPDSTIFLCAFLFGFMVGFIIGIIV